MNTIQVKFQDECFAAVIGEDFVSEVIRIYLLRYTKGNLFTIKLNGKSIKKKDAPDKIEVGQDIEIFHFNDIYERRAFMTENNLYKYYTYKNKNNE